MCCGQKRSLLGNPVVKNPALKNSVVPSYPRPLFQEAPLVPQPVSPGAGANFQAPNPALGGEVALRYLKAVPVRVRGLATGRSYEFLGPQSVQSVDARDVAGLLNTSRFRRA